MHGMVVDESGWMDGWRGLYDKRRLLFSAKKVRWVMSEVSASL